MLQKNILKILLALLFILFPLGQFFKIDALVLIIFLAWLIFAKKNLPAGRQESKPSLFKPFMIFITIALISLALRLPILTSNQSVISALYLFRLVIYASLYFVILDFPDKKFIINGLIFSGVTLSVIGLFQYLVFPDMRVMKYLGWDDHYYRIISTFLDPNFSGIIFACTSLMVLKKNKYLFFLPFIALLLTYSRTAYLSFFLGLCILSINRKQLKIIPISLVIILLLIFLLPKSSGGEGVKLERISSVNNRLESIREGFQVFIKNPILGVGFNTYKFLPGKNLQSHSVSGVENSYVLILATTGILGFLAFLNIFIKLPRQPEIITILVSALFINSLFYPWIMIFFFLIIACT